MAIKLTKTVVDRFKPGPKDEFHWDAEVKGFGARVTPKGKVTFVVQGRVEGSGKEVRSPRTRFAGPIRTWRCANVASRSSAWIC